MLAQNCVAIKRGIAREKFSFEQFFLLHSLDCYQWGFFCLDMQFN